MSSLTLVDVNKYSTRWLEQLIKSDADRMSHCAQVVLELRSDGSVYEKRNPNGASIIAVIGGLELAGHNYQRALLLEVGIGRGKPYTELSGVSFDRRHFAGIASGAYYRIAPYLFHIMQELSDTTVQQWKHPCKTLRLSTTRYVGSSLHKGERNFMFERGKRFSISCDDTLLLGDLCWSHLMTMRHRIMKFAKFIDGSLTCLRGKARKWFVQEWLPLELAERMRAWGPYTLIALEHTAKKKRRHSRLIANFVRQALSGLEPLEFKLANAANYSGVRDRLGLLRVYDATWRRQRVNMSVRTFEVLMPWNTEQMTL